MQLSPRIIASILAACATPAAQAQLNDGQAIRFENRWKHKQFLSIENGPLQVSFIRHDWWSAQWKAVSVSAAAPWYHETWNCTLNKRDALIKIGSSSAGLQLRKPDCPIVDLRLIVRNPANSITLTDRHNGGDSDVNLILGSGVWPKKPIGETVAGGVPGRLNCAAAPEKP